MSNVPQQTLDQTAFGELVTAEPVPLFQVYAVNGLRENMYSILHGTGASVSAVDSNFVIESGTDADGEAVLVTLQDAKYRSGQGLLCRFTALFDTPVADSLQIAGFINDSQGFVFGYDGLEYGIARFYGGAVEYQTLAVATGAAGAENATVTVDGVAYTVPLTAGTVQHNAWEIANSLQAQVPNYFFTSNNDTVSAVDSLAEPNGAFAFTSATAVAAWTQQRPGVTPTEDWVPLANWSNPPDWTIDPSKGNVYQIRMQYLGYGAIQFYMESPITNKFELVHTYGYANANTLPTVEDPTFRVGWVSQNRGNTTNLTVKGATAAAFVEGQVNIDERSRAVDVNSRILTLPAENLITIRNRIEFNDRANRITSYPITCIIAAEHNKAVIFHFHINGTFIGDLDYSYQDKTNSVMEVATDAVQLDLNSGRDLGTVSVRGISSFRLDLRTAVTYLQPGETLTIAAELSSGVGGEADAAIYWLEDQ